MPSDLGFMSAQKNPNQQTESSGIRFGSSREGIRSEDAPLLTGQGHFTDDLNVKGQAYAAFVRASVGHAAIRKVGTDAAKNMPGVIAIITGRDLEADGIGQIPPVASFNGRDGRPMIQAPMPVLAVGRVRYVGEAIAVVIAETEALAQDAAESVEIELDLLPAASNVERALAKGAPAICDAAPGNVVLDWEDGDSAAVDAAFSRAAHVERVRLADTRLAPSAMEPRAAIASYDTASGRYTLVAPTQGVAVVRKVLAEIGRAHV